MIAGIGTDIVEVARIEQLLERRGQAFAQRLLAESELPGFEQHQTPARYLAKRFAAKEAALKALGTGLRNGIRWSDVRVEHDALGKPLLSLHGEALRQFEQLGGSASHISLSDEQHYVVALVILERS